LPHKYDDLSREALIDILKRRDRERKLGLVWERHEIEKDHSVNTDFLVLDDLPELSLGAGPCANLIIEGDNYDTLRWLRTTHRGSIKFIYIDPPYNSGNKTFVYNDAYIDSEDKYRHSKWLEFMYKRLVLARDLMSSDGLIFVSIDDGEMARLRLLMDIVFPSNFQACLVWQSDGNSDNQGIFKIKHEYILVYSRDKTQVSAPPVIDPNIEHGSKLFKTEKRNTIIKTGSKNPVSDLVIPAGFPATFESGVVAPRAGAKEWPKHDEPIVVINSKVQHAVTVRSGWSSKNLYERFVAQGLTPVLDGRNQLTSFELTRTGAIEAFKPRPHEQSHVISVIRNVGSVQKTKEALEQIGIRFDYPKPVGLIEYLLQMVPGNDFTVLDFFAGTGTTAEAVARLNESDGGSRRFIMASSTEATAEEPAKNVCRDACQRRLRAFYVADGHEMRSGQPELFGFRYAQIHRVGVGDVHDALAPQRTWAWLQYVHKVPPAPYDPERIVQTVHLADGSRLLFVDRATPEAVHEVTGALNGEAAYLYCWTPGRFVDQVLSNVLEVRAIPEFFVDRLTQ